MGSREVFFRYGYLKPSGFGEAKELVITGSGFDLLRNSPWLTICFYPFQGTHPIPTSPHPSFSPYHPCTHFFSIPRYVSLENQRRYALRHAHSPQRHHGTTEKHPCHRVFFEACGVGMAGIAGALRKDDRNFSFWGFLVGGGSVGVAKQLEPPCV